MQVFLSGSGKDGWLIYTIRKLLQCKLGVDPYWAAHDAPAKSMIPKIEAAIDKSQAMFVFWTKNVSKHMRTRDFVIFETARAVDRKKPPVFIFKEKGSDDSLLVGLIRTWKTFDPTNQDDIDKTLERIMMLVKTLPGERLRKAIILAAGKGTRMGSYRSGLPKALLKVKHESTILDMQIQSLVECGFCPSNIIVVTGHLSDKIVGFLQKKYPLVKARAIPSAREEDHEMMGSLHEAISQLKLDEGAVILWGDVLFDRQILRDLGRSLKDISLVVDTNPSRRYKLRNSYVDESKGEYDHTYPEEAEKVWVDKEDKIIFIGKKAPVLEGMSKKGEFGGIMRLSKWGMRLFKTYTRKYEENCEKEREQPPLKSLYVVDFLQYLINAGKASSIGLCCWDLDRRLYEIDTPSDLRAWDEEFGKRFIWDSSSK